jgi:hypothetical protein
MGLAITLAPTTSDAELLDIQLWTAFLFNDASRILTKDGSRMSQTGSRTEVN